MICLLLLFYVDEDSVLIEEDAFGIIVMTQHGTAH